MFGRTILLGIIVSLLFSTLFDDIGFISDTLVSHQIPEGTYMYPPDTNPVTRLLSNEYTQTYASMGLEEVAIYVKVEDVHYYW